jgi:hypothetical protein
VPRPKRRASKPKPPRFTEEQISAKAYEIWEKRGQQGTPEENWQTAIAALKQERSPCWKLGHTWQTATHKDNRDFTLDVVKVVISGFGVLGVPVAFGPKTTLRNLWARSANDKWIESVEKHTTQDED